MTAKRHKREFQFHHVNCHNFSYPVGQNITRITQLCKVFRRKLVILIGKDTNLQIWCRGSSGAMIAALVSQSFTDVNIIHVKKPGENSHTYGVNARPDCVNIIVDDFARTCSTLHAIHKEMEAYEVSLDHVCLLGSIMINNLKFNPKSLVASELFVHSTPYRHNSGKVVY